MRLSRYLIVDFAGIALLLIVSLFWEGTLHDKMRIFVYLLFATGGGSMVLGYLIYIGQGNPGIEKFFIFLLGYREMQRGHGTRMIISGLAHIGLSMAIIIFFF